MKITENKSLGAAVVLGLFLCLGLALAGYWVGKGLERFRSDSRSVIVKGLVEREVKSDRAIWTLRFRRAGDSIREVHTQISADREAVMEFLSRQGFSNEEIRRLPTRTIDKLAREYVSPGQEGFRYLVTASLAVASTEVDRITAALEATEELLTLGVLLDQEEGSANPRYIVSTFNALRPELLADATRNARFTAQQFADDAGTRVGRIRSANQGSIQIFGSDGNNESSPYSATSTPVKIIRVVSTFEFELQ
ncbi:SIMPL domain-containing protein [Desulfobulbus alkaliphilus]|uniref:SIMPL domain-containing protein n=1 Tax=Desulfobulbus alkaliphilus TaxID=869814 RepID=UPI0019629D9C|nr:SIMPL domain-containing protein [Desulfobulbus alkaliphilus]MBM9536985.1 SIMPL domain-containing protein [Desulfobulbus alkaliphilus]